jgi:hypothetical protein
MWFLVVKLVLSKVPFLSAVCHDPHQVAASSAPQPASRAPALAAPVFREFGPGQTDHCTPMFGKPPPQTQEAANAPRKSAFRQCRIPITS